MDTLIISIALLLNFGFYMLMIFKKKDYVHYFSSLETVLILGTAGIISGIFTSMYFYYQSKYPDKQVSGHDAELITAIDFFLVVLFPVLFYSYLNKFAKRRAERMNSQVDEFLMNEKSKSKK